MTTDCEFTADAFAKASRAFGVQRALITQLMRALCDATWSVPQGEYGAMPTMRVVEEGREPSYRFEARRTMRAAHPLLVDDVGARAIAVFAAYGLEVVKRLELAPGQLGLTGVGGDVGRVDISMHPSGAISFKVASHWIRGNAGLLSERLFPGQLDRSMRGEFAFMFYPTTDAADAPAVFEITDGMPPQPEYLRFAKP